MSQVKVRGEREEDWEGLGLGPVDDGERGSVQLKGRVEVLDLASGFEGFAPLAPDRSFHSEIDFFETVMSYGLNEDERVTFLLVNAYIAANQQDRGIGFFQRLLKMYRDKMSDEVAAVYLSAYAILRATFAERVVLWRRVGWMFETFKLLDEAQRLTNNSHPIVHWSAGLIYAQVPFFFFKKQKAYQSLHWLANRPETEPVPGFYREVYHHLAKLYAGDGQRALAERYLKRSGYDEYEPKALFMGWFTTAQVSGSGTAMAAEPTLEEVVPGRVFVLTGFGFSDVYFVLSKQGRELIAIDAGTQPFSLQAAHEFLLERYPELPAISTVFITHAHWDHIGGHGYFRALNDDLIIYGRDNYQGVVERVLREHSYRSFRGEDFDPSWVSSYAPDVLVDQERRVEVDGSVFDLIPVTGGETEDALLVHMPDLDVMFVGDVVMPWYGEPWVNEGFVDEAVATMDEVLSRGPKQILHGHHPLTLLYGAEQLALFRDHYVWLINTVKDHVAHGFSVKEIVRLNLIPPGLQDQPSVYLAYVAARDSVIARVADKMVGIWQEDVTGLAPEGLDQLTVIEYGRLLEVYLGLSVSDLCRALEKMLANGDNELALKLAIAGEQRYGAGKRLTAFKEEAADRLRSAAQFFDPFKFVTYTEMIGKVHKPLGDDRLS